MAGYGRARRIQGIDRQIVAGQSLWSLGGPREVILFERRFERMKSLDHETVKGQFADYFGGKLDIVEYTRCQLHLDNCDSCRKEAFRYLMKQKASIPRESSTTCLKDQTIRDYLNNKLLPDEKRLFRNHVSICDCAKCRDRLYLMRDDKPA